MKPAPFEYYDPDTVDEVLTLLAEYGDDARLLAGGQSLIPLLNFRLARPAIVIGLHRVRALDYLESGEGMVSIGAMTRQATLEKSRLVGDHVPLLLEAIRFVGHPQIRNRGTVGGSAAHGDPAGELPTAFCALDAGFHLRSTSGARTVGAQEFFVGHYATAIASDEMLVQIDVPVDRLSTGNAFEEFARRQGDYALGGAAAVITVDRVGVCRRASVALLGGGSIPVRAVEAASLLIGTKIEREAAREAAAVAVADVAPLGDSQGDSDYRRVVVGAMCRRAILRAARQAVEVDT